MVEGTHPVGRTESTVQVRFLGLHQLTLLFKLKVTTTVPVCVRQPVAISAQRKRNANQIQRFQAVRQPVDK